MPLLIRDKRCSTSDLQENFREYFQQVNIFYSKDKPMLQYDNQQSYGFHLRQMAEFVLRPELRKMQSLFIIPTLLKIQIC